MRPSFPIIWLTGNTGAGKTTLAYGLRDAFEEADRDHPLCRRVLVLDGDEMRASISLDATLSPCDRRAHNLRVARLAAVLRAQGFLVLVAVIAPFAAVRAEIDAICSPLWVYVKRSGLAAADKPYEAPDRHHCIIDNDVYSIAESRAVAEKFLRGVVEGVGAGWRGSPATTSAVS